MESAGGKGVSVREPLASSTANNGQLVTVLFSAEHWGVASRRGGLSPTSLRAPRLRREAHEEEPEF